MARIRTLKPEICEDAMTAGLSDAAFRLFVSSIVLADDHGNLQGDERWLRSTIWWAHDDSPRIAEILRELRRANLVTLYQVRGQSYLHIRGWGKHQRIDNAGKPRVPRQDDTEAVVINDDNDGSDPTRGNPPRDSANRGEIPPDLRPPTSDPEGDPDLSRSQARGEKKPRARRSPMTTAPPDWKPTDAHRKQAATLNLDCDACAIDFLDHHAAKGTLFADWNAAFRTWLRNAPKFAKPNLRIVHSDNSQPFRPAPRRRDIPDPPAGEKKPA